MGKITRAVCWEYPSTLKQKVDCTCVIEQINVITKQARNGAAEREYHIMANFVNDKKLVYLLKSYLISTCKCSISDKTCP